MYDFTYHRPKSLADAVSLLKGKEEGRPMSGGMTLIPTLKQRLAKPSDVVDLGGIKDIKIPADDLNSDIHGSAEYRAHLVTVMARRAVDAANK